MSDRGKMRVKIAISAAVVIGVCVVAFLKYNKHLRDTAPEYIVHDTYEQAIEAAELHAQEVGGKVFTSEGESNAYVLPFELSRIVMVKIPYEDIQPDMFVSYISEYGAIMHRAIRKDPDGWVVMGDANLTVDKTKVTEANYLRVLHPPIHTWKSVYKK